MSSKTAVNAIACPPGALAGGPVRTRFFDGMFLTQADLETEQRFWRIKRRLTNRALGEGVVWGLRLDWKGDKKRSFSLSPGYALDCCGNDLIVECPIEISEAQLWQRADPALRTDPVVQPAPDPDGDGDEMAAGDVRHACVILQYVECAEEARPVHRDACAGPTGHCEPSRIRESARLLLVPEPAPRPLTPPEQFLEELYRWRDSLPANIRAVLFPDPGTPPVSPGSGLAPLTLRASLGGGIQADIQVPASGSASAPTFSATQTPPAGRPTGVVTFELLPSSGWHLVAGRVLDGTRVVETVTPPASPSMYWALDVALPEDPAASQPIEFEFLLEDVELAQAFGGSERGRVRATVTGVATVSSQSNGAQVNITVDELTVTTELAEVFEDEGQGCLRELVPWGWTVDPANGQKIASTLVLASLYAFLSEVTRRNSSPQWRTLATALYAGAWYLLFRVNPVAGPPATAAHRAKLAELLLALYRRWCEGFAYPGPRCFDEHHGVYLGCITYTRAGAIQSFDMWEHRRYVLTGPVINHWAGQFGIAPIDVIVGRFARAMCCLAGLPPLTLPEFTGGGNDMINPGLGAMFGSNKMVMGTVADVEEFASGLNTHARWVSSAELAMHMPRAFTSSNSMGPADVVAHQVTGGMSLAVAVPRTVQQGPNFRLHDDVLTLMRRGDLMVRASGREPAAEMTVAVLREASPAALLDAAAPPETRDTAAALASRGATAAWLAENGAVAALRRSGRPDRPEWREAAADLVDRAEAAAENVTRAIVKVLGPRFDRKAFGVAGNQTKIGEEVVKIIPGLTVPLVVAAASRVAGR